MNHIKLFFIAILLPFLSIAQGNFKPGLIVNAKGDTVHGFVDLKEWGNNPQSINFKASLTGSQVSYTVNDITYFAVTEIVAYKAANTTVSLDETNIARLGRGRDTSSRTDHIFLKTEQRGNNVTLYSYQDDVKKRFYIYDAKTGKLSELTYRVYFAPSGSSNTGTINQEAYKQQLLLIAQQFGTYKESLRSEIEEAQYNEAYLAPICRKINASNQEVNTRNLPHLKFFAGVGAVYSSFSPKGDFLVYNAKSNSSISPSLSVGINFYPQPDIESSVLRLELLYSSGKYTTTGNTYIYDTGNITHYSVSQTTFSLIPQFQYSVYNTDPFKFYLNAGVSANFSTYSGNTFTNSGGETSENYLGLNTLWMSVPAKAGIVLNKKIDISLTYSFPISITDNHAGQHQNYNYSLDLQTIRLTLGYIFK